jgi:hypothetical protein
MALTKVNASMVGSGSSTTFSPSVPIYENTQTISANTTITSGSSAVSAGPISISAGVTVTVPSGSTWVVL